MNFNIKKRLNDFKLYRAWLTRNDEHGEILMESLELDYIYFQQSIFVEDDSKLAEKLTRIGFEPLYGFPDEKLFEGFSKIMYNKKHNIAISLYNTKDKSAIQTAKKIVDESVVENETALAVFLATIKVLRTPNKQVLLG